jgi:hypothetical protein
MVFVRLRLLTFACGACNHHWPNDLQFSIGFNQWKKDPTRVETEALAGAIGDFEQFERVTQDIEKMKRLGRPTPRVIWRYIGVCFALNLITVSLSAIPSFAVRVLLKMTGH